MFLASYYSSPWAVRVLVYRQLAVTPWAIAVAINKHSNIFWCVTRQAAGEQR